MAGKLDDLEKQIQQLELEANIADKRAMIVEANVRRMKAQAEYAELRAALAAKRK